LTVAEVAAAGRAHLHPFGASPKPSVANAQQTNQVSMCKSLCHVSDEGQHLRVDFTPGISHAHCIIVTFAGLVNDRDAVLCVASNSAASTNVRLMTSAPWLRR